MHYFSPIKTLQKLIINASFVNLYERRAFCLNMTHQCLAYKNDTKSNTKWFSIRYQQFCNVGLIQNIHIIIENSCRFKKSVYKDILFYFFPEICCEYANTVVGLGKIFWIKISAKITFLSQI